jgi:hypothetical protein
MIAGAPVSGSAKLWHAIQQADSSWMFGLADDSWSYCDRL